jgi:hypothetical protein
MQLIFLELTESMFRASWDENHISFRHFLLLPVYGNASASSNHVVDFVLFVVFAYPRCSSDANNGRLDFQLQERDSVQLD